VDGYILTFATLLLTSGSIGDRYGRKKTLIVGLIWFGIVSALAGFSPSTNVLIGARSVLGVGGALILPATLSIITVTFPPNERAQAIAIWAAIFGLGVALGPILGGFLLEHFDWNSVFLVSLPVCAIAAAGSWRYLGDSHDENPPALDLPGVVLSIAGLFALVFGIISAGVRGWTDTTVIVSLAIALVVLSIFGWWEAHSPNAMLPLRFFRNMSFTAASITMAFVTFCQFTVLFFFSPYFQTVQGYSTFQAGLRLLPLALTLTIMATISARVAAWIGTKYTVTLGLLVAAGGYFYIAQIYRVDTPFPLAMLGQIIIGVGVGLTFSPATNSIMGSVPFDKAGIGSAMNDTTRQFGGALGVAVMGTILNLSYTGSINALKTALPQLPPDTLAQINGSLQAAHQVATSLPATASRTVLAIVDQAYVSGMDHAFTIGTEIVLCVALFALLFLPNRIRRADDYAAPVAEPTAALFDASTGK
ncbi:MAG TPA: MFS transporter, partial [Aggregatilineaceae bacterium]|nr:MFS transporter [Aggregatilineaceae bacterium]